MSNKLLSRLLSFTMSATVALTSGVPALAYDGGGGDLLEVEDEELLEIEDEVQLDDAGADFDAQEEFFATEDDAEFEFTADMTINFDLSGVAKVTLSDNEKENYIPNPGTPDKPYQHGDRLTWASDKDYVFVAEAVTGYYFDYDKDIVTIGWASDGSTAIDMDSYTLDDTAAKNSGAYTISQVSDSKAVITISSNYLERFIAARGTTDNSKDKFIIKANDAATKARDVSVTVDSSYPAPIPAELLKAKFDSALASIDMTSAGYEISGKPITGVIVYVGTGKEASPTTLTVSSNPASPTPASDDYNWYNGILTLYATGINKGLVRGLTIKFLSENYTLNLANPSTGVGLEFHGTNDATGSAISLIPKTSQPANVSAKLITDVSGRLLKTATVVEKNPATGEVISESAASVAGGGAYATWATPVNGDVYVTVTTTDQVTYSYTAASPAYGLTPPVAGSSATDNGITTVTCAADTGKDYTFGVYAGTGLSLAASEPVKYVQKVGSSTVTKAATDNHNGTYTIPASDMVRATEITVSTTADSTGLKNVDAMLKDQTGKKNIVSLDKFTIKDMRHNITIPNDGNAVSAGTAAAAKKDGEKFYFQVKADSGFKVSYVGYKTPGQENPTEAAVEDASLSVYSIPATVLGPVTLVIDGEKTVAVNVSNNKKAVVKINGVQKSSVDSVTTQMKDQFKFSVAGADSSIKITRVGYKIGSSGTLVDASALLGENERATEYTIAADDVTDTINIYVQTLETVNEADGKYFVDFADVSNGAAPTSVPTGNVGWDYAYAKGTYPPVGTTPPVKIVDTSDSSGYKRNSKDLRVAQNSTATITPVIKKVDGTATGSVLVAASDIAEATYTTGSGTKTYIDAAATTGAVTGAIKAVKQGADTVEYTVVSKHADSNYNENLVKLTGSLSVKVEPKFRLAIVEPGREFVNSTPLGLQVIAVNGATDIPTNASSTADGWCASAPTYKWTPLATGKVITTSESNKLTTNAKTNNFTKDDPSDGVAYKLSITDTDDTVYTSNTVTLYPVVDTKYALVPTIKISGGQELFNATSATIGVEDLNSATVTYQLYRMDPSDNISNYVDQDAIDTALDNPEVEGTTGWLRKVDATYTYEAISSLGANADKSFFSGTANGNVYTIKALKKSAARAAVTAYATVGHEKISTTINFTVNQNQNLVPVNLKLNDGANQKNALGNVVSHRFAANSSYKDIWMSLNAPADPTDPTTDPDGVSDGYQLKVAAGTEIKLPEESDLDQTLFTDKTRMITGWKITPQAAGNTSENNGSAFYKKPGDKLVILGQTTGIVTIEPVWSARYKLDSTGTYGYYIDLGTTTTTEITNDDGTKTTITIPDTSTAFDSSVGISGEGKKIGAVVQVAKAKAAATPDYTTYLYPGTTNGTGISAGKIEWFAYDDANTTASNGVTLAQIQGKTAWVDEATKTAASTNTALDATKLKNGQLLGLKNTVAEAHATKSVIYAKYTAPDGTVVYSDALLKNVAIDQTEVAYTVDITGLPDEIEVGESITLGVGTPTPTTSEVKIYKNTAAYAGANSDKFTWNISPANSLTIENASDLIAGKVAPIVTGKVASSTKVSVTLTYTDAYGVSVTSAAKEITVKPASYTLAIVDKDGKALSSPVIEANVGGTSYFYLQVKDSAGTVTAVTSTASWASSDATVIANSGVGTNALETAGLIRRGTVAAKTGGAVIDALDDCELTISLTINNKVYSIVVPAKTYYSITFDASAAKQATGTAATIAALTTASNITLSKSGTAYKAGENIVERFYKEDLDDKDKYTMDLSAYSAAYGGTTKAVGFVGWYPAAAITVNGTTITPATPGTMTDTKSSAITKLTKLTPANVVMCPNFSDAPVATITTNKDTIVLDNQKYDVSYKENIVVSVTGVDTLDKVYFAADQAFAFVAADKKGATNFTNDSTFDGTAFTASSTNVTQMSFEVVGANDTARSYIFAVAPEGTALAGKGKFIITSQNSDVKKAVTVIVTGPYNDGVGDRFMLESGEDAVSTEVTFKAAGTTTDTTFFYDADGYKINTGIAKDKNGNFYVLKGGSIQKGYVLNADGKGHATYADPTTGIITPNSVAKINGTNTYYIDENGLIAVPSIAAGAQYGLVGTAPALYLADETGKILTESAFKALGVEALVIGGQEYIVSTDDIASPADVRYAPVVKFSEWPTSWKKNTSAPTITYTVTYQSARQGKAIEDTTVYAATVTSEPATIDSSTKKVTFTATTNLSKYYADKEGTKAAENVTTTKTYMFLDEESDDSEEIIEISDEESGIVIVGLKAEYDYTGGKIIPTIQVYDSAEDAILLAKNADYTLEVKNNIKVGTATITVKGKGNYAGKSQTASFKIVDRRAEMTDAEIAELGEVKGLKLAVKKYTYTGKPIFPETITVKFASGEKTYKNESTDPYDYDYRDADGEIPAVVTISNNIDKGSAKITVTGKNNSKGKATTKSAAFSIAAAPLVAGKDGKDLEVSLEDDSYEWQAKGAVPYSMSVTWNGEELLPNQDYTVKYVNNTKVGDATVTITGKGNFSGTVKEAAKFKVTALDLGATDPKAYIAATTAAAGVKGKAVKVTVLDSWGNVIPTGKYKVTVKDESGNVVTDKLEAEKNYTVEVTRKSEKVTELNAETLAVTVTTGQDFSKAKIKVASKYSRYYTGTPLVYESADEIDEFNSKVAVTLSGTTLKLGEDFEITGYTNNIKKGTMTVTLTGIGKYSGTKNVKIKIAAKPLTK